MNDNNELKHYGVMGMKWGVRRYQPYPKGHKGKFVGPKPKKPRKGVGAPVEKLVGVAAKRKANSLRTSKPKGKISPEKRRALDARNKKAKKYEDRYKKIQKGESEYKRDKQQYKKDMKRYKEGQKILKKDKEFEKGHTSGKHHRKIVRQVHKNLNTSKDIIKLEDEIMSKVSSGKPMSRNEIMNRYSKITTREFNKVAGDMGVAKSETGMYELIFQENPSNPNQPIGLILPTKKGRKVYGHDEVKHSDEEAPVYKMKWEFILNEDGVPIGMKPIEDIQHMDDDELMHYGVLGMKWGVRRYQPYPKGHKGKGKFVGKKKSARLSRRDGARSKKAHRKATKQKLNKTVREAVDLSKSTQKEVEKNTKFKHKKSDFFDTMPEEWEDGSKYKQLDEYLTERELAYNKAISKKKLPDGVSKIEFDKREVTGDDLTFNELVYDKKGRIMNSGSRVPKQYIDEVANETYKKVKHSDYDDEYLYHEDDEELIVESEEVELEHTEKEVETMKFDFSGYVTKNDLLCSDGRIIRKDAFKHNDGEVVPLVWQHQHNDPSNVLGHMLLENREDGVYAYGKFNDTPNAKNAKKLVQHGDIRALSIYANKLKQQGNNVLHGAIREVSLVLSGANPGASIDNVSFAHTDGSIDVDYEEAIIYTGEVLEHSEPIVVEKEVDHVEHKESEQKTVGDIFNTLNDEQKNVVYAMIAHATGEIDKDEGTSEEEDKEEIKHSGGDYMNTDRNIFESQGYSEEPVLSHGDVQNIISDAVATGSLRDSVLYHAEEYGIENIDILFPDAKTVGEYPHMIQRDMGWVGHVLSKTRKSPFSRIKTVSADITEEEARAKGYVTGSKKTEEVFKLLQRTTSPTTIYKKQKLDRDDIVDITTLDVVAFIKKEMRIMLDEEIARAVLIGDGRSVTSPDKINEDNIRPIYTDDELYTHRIEVSKEATPTEIIETALRGRKHWKGSGRPTFYTTTDIVTDMLLEKDKMGRRIYNTEEELKAALRVADIVEVEPMEGLEHNGKEAIGIFVNLDDYTVGADRGGEVNMFDDFDIDFNQHKYLLETRISGALRHPKSALVLEYGEGGVESRSYDELKQDTVEE